MFWRLFFFQAEDGIRDYKVTGVQTCALPIWLLHAAQTLVVLEARPDDGPDFVTVVEAGLLAKAGLNAAGLGLVTNALVTDADVGEPGLPYHVLLRAILDCA